jgi:hypothetical protein
LRRHGRHCGHQRARDHRGLLGLTKGRAGYQVPAAQ